MVDVMGARTATARRDRPTPGAGRLPERSICLYTPSADPSGMGAHMIDLAERFVARGADVSVMAWPTEPGERLLATARSVGARPLAMPHPRDAHFAEAVGDFLAASPVDVFHVHVGTGRENFDGARAARAAGVPALLQTQHLPWRLSSPGKRRPFFAAIEPVDLLIAVSAAQRRTYERIGVPSERFATVLNGVRPRGPGPGRDRARQALGLQPDQPVVMSVGRLTVMKGQRHLIDALPRLLERFPQLAVVLVGEGHLRDSLSEQADALGVSHAVHLVGHRADARALLDAADVFALPSLHEGMPLAAMEAMDAGLPVVGTDVIGTSEVVDDGRTGLLVPPRDAEALAGALSVLLGDTALRGRFSTAARRRYLESFTADRMAADTAQVYEQVLSADRAPR